MNTRHADKNKPSSTAAWSSKSIGSKRKHLFFYYILKYFGLRPAKILLFFVVLVYSLRPTVCKRSLPYLSRLFGPASLHGRWKQVWHLYWTFGQVLLERAATGILGAKNIISRPEDVVRMQSLLDEGRGLILLNAHVGFWQIAVSGFPSSTKVNMAIFRDSGDVDKHFFEHGTHRDWPSIKLINMKSPFGGFLEMSEALKQGEVLCLMGDRLDADDKLCVTVNFLGGKVQWPAYPYLLASMLGAPILVTLVWRRSPMIGETLSETIIRVPEKVGRSSEALQPYAQAYADALEKFVQEHPEQYFNFFDMWIN